jgi:hypothetical protein
MILSIHSDASYLSKNKCILPCLWSFIHGLETLSFQTHHIKWFILLALSYPKIVVVSAAKAVLCTFFPNCKQARIFILALEEMGHPQTPTPIVCNNSTAVGIANNTRQMPAFKLDEDAFFLGCQC